MPQSLRLKTVQTTLGPSGGWFIKEKVVGRVPTLLGCKVKRVEVREGKAHLRVCAADGPEREIAADHIIAATGYKVDMNRLAFISPSVRARIKTLHGSPVLSSTFESSMPGIYFVGVAAANSFGPVMRFAFGAGYAAQTVTRTMMKSLARGSAWVAAESVVGNTE